MLNKSRGSKDVEGTQVAYAIFISGGPKPEGAKF